MLSTGTVVGGAYIVTLIVAFAMGGPPAEIIVGIPGIVYLAYRWKK